MDDTINVTVDNIVNDTVTHTVDDKVNGTVKWFDPDKGFGFITTEEDEDVFVHFSQIEKNGFRTLEDDEEVEFDVVEGDKGPQAENVASK